MANDRALTNLDGVLDALRSLPPAIASKGGGPVRVALAKAARRIRDRARQLAPKDSGAMAENIVMKRDTRPDQVGANERYRVGVRGGARRYANTKRNVRNGRAGKKYETAGATYYWRFKEFGTRLMAPEPFLRPAFDQEAGPALDAIGDDLEKAIHAAAKRAAKG